VKAKSVELDVRGGRIRRTSGVAGLNVARGVALVRTLRTSGPAPQAAALVVRLERSRSGLAPGTTIVVGFALVPRKAAGTHDEPLKVTPPLGLSGYVFPVVGEVSYGDTYGAFRGDVPGNWHHGDDIFAKLGTPVVAVASGTLNRVGWEKLGGWRLWVRDSLGNEFYYAHLAAYSPRALRSNNVTAGEVVGFIGNTGDAFTTWPHLHFEVHPRSLLHLGYNGAVDPTTYLDHWRHLPRIRAPRPAHPRFPRATALRREASYVWRQLLAARGLVHPQAPKTPARASGPGGASIAVPPAVTPVPSSPPAGAIAAPRLVPGAPPDGLPLGLLLGSLGGAVALVAAAAVAASRRGRLPALAGARAYAQARAVGAWTGATRRFHALRRVVGNSYRL
jgi:murein DD-endopeptidase MepM/ murein hydrolase activator NlpD